MLQCLWSPTDSRNNPYNSTSESDLLRYLTLYISEPMRYLSCNRLCSNNKTSLAIIIWSSTKRELKKGCIANIKATIIFFAWTRYPTYGFKLRVDVTSQSLPSRLRQRFKNRDLIKMREVPSMTGIEDFVFFVILFFDKYCKDKQAASATKAFAW